jgi:hypothetical protein
MRTALFPLITGVRLRNLGGQESCFVPILALFSLKLLYSERKHRRYSVDAGFPADDGQSIDTQLESQFLLRKTKARAGLLQLRWYQEGLFSKGPKVLLTFSIN